MSMPAHAVTRSGAPTTAVVVVDFSQSTGPVKGGATGMLYGLSDPGVPGDALLSAANPSTVAQKAPGGAQHPNGDAMTTADGFFASGGREIVVYLQDVLSQWPYEKLGIEEYLAKVDAIVAKTVAHRPSDIGSFVWVPFNEPDWIWYGDWATQKQEFFDDWKRAVEHIRAIDPDARIVGPNEAAWHPERVRDFLTWAKDATCDRAPHGNCLPDIMAWHELERRQLGAYRDHFAQYRALERELGIAPLPVNIDEYGNRRDMSVPGQMIQWISLFEDTKVDADMAYWTFAGNLDDHAVQTRKANGGWWLLKWYADLTGETVKVVPPRPDTPDTVQATAVLDKAARRAIVLVGGGANDLSLDLSGLDHHVFGAEVDVRISKTTWSGYEGDAGKPTVVAAWRAHVDEGALTVPIPSVDVMAAYRVLITPVAGGSEAAGYAAPWSTSVEAECAALTDAIIYAKDTTADPQLYATSGKRDVGAMNKATSTVTLTVTVPRTGSYRLGIFYGTNAAPGRQALFVDGVLNQVIQYTATLSWSYRGRTDVSVQLGAGTHELSVRTSVDGSTVLPGCDITLDKFDLTEVAGPQISTHDADDARLSGGATIVGSGKVRAVDLGQGGVATFYIASEQDGYQDLTLVYDADCGGAVGLSIDGRPIDGLETYPGEGHFRARVHLAAGISMVRVTGTTCRILGLIVVRAADADAEGVVMVEAEAALLTGTARVVQVAVTSGSNASGGAYVDGLGNGSANTLTISRPEDFGPGEYNLAVHYANAAKQTGHEYNTDVISRSLDITEVGGETTRSVYRHNYAWDNFWSQVTPVRLTTTNGDIVLGNASQGGPNVDRVELARFVLEVENEHRPQRSRVTESVGCSDA